MRPSPKPGGDVRSPTYAPESPLARTRPWRPRRIALWPTECAPATPAAPAACSWARWRNSTWSRLLCPPCSPLLALALVAARRSATPRVPCLLCYGSCCVFGCPCPGALALPPFVCPASLSSLLASSPLPTPLPVAPPASPWHYKAALGVAFLVVPYHHRAVLRPPRLLLPPPVCVARRCSPSRTRTIPFAFPTPQGTWDCPRSPSLPPQTRTAPPTPEPSLPERVL